MCVGGCTCTCMHEDGRFGKQRQRAMSAEAYTWVSCNEPHNNTALHLSEPPPVLNPASPGDVEGRLLRMPSQIALGLPELISVGDQIQLLFPGELASCLPWKSCHTSLEEHEKPMPVLALEPGTLRMPIPVGDSHWQAMTRGLSKALSHDRLGPDVGHELLCCFNSPQGREETGLTFRANAKV